MIARHLGKILVACNAAVLAMLAVNMALGIFLLDADSLKWALVATYAGIAAISAGIFWIVLHTYRQFREKDLLVGTVGFGIVFFTYTATFVTLPLGISSVPFEAAVNVLAAFGYGFIVLSCGWLK
jgi:hypothetical protein